VAELVLIGREFGDLDEGSIPVLLARRLGRPLFSLAQHAEWRDDKVRLMRERGTCEQGLDVEQPLLASVTNDKRNKLRHPLMKNVMEAKRMSFSSVEAPGQGAGMLPLLGLSAARVSERGGNCTMLEGNTRLQARALLAYLKDQGVNP
jgi:electron transfer flavoprotein beta subunit